MRSTTPGSSSSLALEVSTPPPFQTGTDLSLELSSFRHQDRLPDSSARHATPPLEAP